MSHSKKVLLHVVSQTTENVSCTHEFLPHPVKTYSVSALHSMKCKGLQIWSAEVGRKHRQQHTPHTNMVTSALHVLHYCNTVCVSPAGTVYITVTACALSSWHTEDYCDTMCTEQLAYCALLWLHVHSPAGTVYIAVTLHVHSPAGTLKITVTLCAQSSWHIVHYRDSACAQSSWHIVD
jgi:hypothetical protein